jgi:predicted glycosyltransferase
MPAGPYGELLGALEALDARGGLAVAGFRDVIDEPGFVRELWEHTGVYEVLRAYYRAICVYGDPAMVDFVPAYGLDDELAARTHYCGYLGRQVPAATETPVYQRPLVLANGGGGADGVTLMKEFVTASQHLRPQHGGTWLMVTGPMLDADTHEQLARAGAAAGLTVRRIVPELRAHVALADCVISMAGYNTCCDLLTFRRPAVLIPREGPNREQRIRARRFAEWGAARVVQAAYAHNTVTEALEATLQGGDPRAAPVSLDGIDRAIDTFDRVLAGQRAAV